jgi:hypothetical protein
MKEQLISFKTAKLAKEKGFKELCDSHYFEDGEFRENTITNYNDGEVTYEIEEFEENWNDGFLTKKNGERCFGCSKSQGYLDTFSAPTQALLQKWLREEHKMIVEIIFDYEYEVWEFECFYPDSVDKAVTYYSDIFQFKTYEEALEAGLKQALELI